ncbi:MAG TPA: divalent-cation tolerance protein CutA [Halothiobacillaceae bacterium]|nr:divalent-cation tolerance protein CutA [Halothiobacillaceae bacterium]
MVDQSTEKLNLIVSTVDDQQQARTLIGALLEKRLIACGSISAAIESHFNWQGSRQHETEYQLFLKTVPEKTPELLQTLERIHPYDCPEILLFSPDSSKAYARWAREQTA